MFDNEHGITKVLIYMRFSLDRARLEKHNFFVAFVFDFSDEGSTRR